jgi:hypothetical protein
MKKRAATILLLTYCLLFFGSTYHFHPQEPLAALHCKVCAISEATILTPATSVQFDVNNCDKLIVVPCTLGSQDQLSAVTGRSPPLA